MSSELHEALEYVLLGDDRYSLTISRGDQSMTYDSSIELEEFFDDLP